MRATNSLRCLAVVKSFQHCKGRRSFVLAWVCQLADLAFHLFSYVAVRLAAVAELMLRLTRQDSRDWTSPAIAYVNRLKREHPHIDLTYEAALIHLAHNPSSSVAAGLDDSYGSIAAMKASLGEDRIEIKLMLNAAEEKSDPELVDVSRPCERGSQKLTGRISTWDDSLLSSFYVTPSKSERQEGDLYWCSSLPPMSGQPVGMYWCSSLPPMSGQPVGMYWCSSLPPMSGQPVGMYWCSSLPPMSGQPVGMYWCSSLPPGQPVGMYCLDSQWGCTGVAHCSNVWTASGDVLV